jgi:hypothetical protein
MTKIKLGEDTIDLIVRDGLRYHVKWLKAEIAKQKKKKNKTEVEQSDLLDSQEFLANLRGALSYFSAHGDIIH